MQTYINTGSDASIRASIDTLGYHHYTIGLFSWVVILAFASIRASTDTLGYHHDTISFRSHGFLGRELKQSINHNHFIS